MGVDCGCSDEYRVGDFVLSYISAYCEKRVLMINAEWAIYLNTLIYGFFYSLFYINVGLFVFNLLPVYPLDGFRLYDALTTNHGRVYYTLRKNGFYILIGIILLGYVADITGIWWLDFLPVITNYVATPIIKLWGLILGL